MTRYVCSKLFTDVNMKFPYNGLKNCCKANDYDIPLEEILELRAQGKNLFTHNEEYQRRKRSMLFDNKLPELGCDTCIHAEPNSLFRQWNTWDPDNLGDLEKLAEQDSFTSYEFVLSSACDLKCVYCSSKDSTSWAKELNEPINRGEEDWKQAVLQELREHLHAKQWNPAQDYWFFFSGGEPTYNPETLPLIEEILSIMPRGNIVISTNANTKTKILDRYLETVRAYPDTTWIFDCSIDDTACHAEAIRTNLRWDIAIHNIKRLTQEPNIRVRISPTVNLYSIPRMLQFVQFFHKFLRNHGQAHDNLFNMNMVQEPELSPWSMPKRYTSYLDPAILYCEENGLTFADHLRSVQKLIGTKIDENTADHIERKWRYFKAVRPEHNWEHLFQHVPKIIEELRNE